MAPKKKAAAKEGEEEDLSVHNFFKYYRKKCGELGVPMSKIIREKYDEYVEDEDQIITKVRIILRYIPISFICGTSSAGRALEP